MTPSLPYLLGILLIVFVIDFTLRALPFKILEPLRLSLRREHGRVDAAGHHGDPGPVDAVPGRTGGRALVGGAGDGHDRRGAPVQRSQAPVERRSWHGHLHCAAELALSPPKSHVI